MKEKKYRILTGYMMKGWDNIIDNDNCKDWFNICPLARKKKKGSIKVEIKILEVENETKSNKA